VRARTAGAHAGQPHGSRIAFNTNELDVAAIGVQEGSHAIEDHLDAFLRNHDSLLRESPGTRPGFAQLHLRATDMPAGLRRIPEVWRLFDGHEGIGGVGRGFFRTTWGKSPLRHGALFEPELLDVLQFTSTFGVIDPSEEAADQHG
jgi:hypothetical protein